MNEGLFKLGSDFWNWNLEVSKTYSEHQMDNLLEITVQELVLVLLDNCSHADSPTDPIYTCRSHREVVLNMTF